MEKSITVVTVVLNSANLLERTIASLKDINQEFEYIVIDGDSTDGTVSVVYNSQEVNKFISEKDEGISDAFNKGISMASGDYVLLLNAGDELMPDSLEHYQQAIRKQPDVDIFYGDIIYFDEDKEFIYLEKSNLANIWKYMSIYHPGMLVKKSSYNDIGGYSCKYKYAMDSEWLHRAIKNQLKIEYVPHAFVGMAVGGKSDKYFYYSLREFCMSSIKHGPSRIAPLYYFGRQLLVHSLLKITMIKKWRVNRKSN